MFNFRMPRWQPPRRRLPLSLAHVVARAVPGAPCGWVFFDGSETRIDTQEGEAVIIPGGAFFPREAHRFASEEEAQAEAARLNDSSLCLDRPWRVRAASAFMVERVEASGKLLARHG
jgi:hypothetical protein